MKMENKNIIVIDATGMILGRLANKVAKLALEGEQVAIVNCEAAVISGKQPAILQKFKQRITRTQPFKGPFIQKMPDRMVKSVIRGMLPHAYWSEGRRGRTALSRIKCYIGVPAEFKAAKPMVVEGADAADLKTKHRLTVGKLSELLRA